MPPSCDRIDSAMKLGDFSDFEEALAEQPALCVRALMRLCHNPRLASERARFIAKLMGYPLRNPTLGKACQIAASLDNTAMLGALGARCPENMSPLIGLAREGKTACFRAFWPHATFDDRSLAFQQALVAGRTDIALIALESSTELTYAGEAFSDCLLDSATRHPRRDPSTLEAVLGWAASRAEHLALLDACDETPKSRWPNAALRV